MKGYKLCLTQERVCYYYVGWQKYCRICLYKYMRYIKRNCREREREKWRAGERDE